MKIKHSRVRNVLAAGSVGLALLAAGAVAAAGTGSGAATLLSRVQHAYRNTPGIELAATARSRSARTPARRFLLGLHHGTVTAEEFIGPGRHGVLLVARRGGPTFRRVAGGSCWGRLHRSDSRTLLNVGSPFPEHGKALIRHNKAGVRQLVIETHSAFWYLAGSVVPAQIARKSFLTVTPNAATYTIRSIRVRAPEPSVQATLTVKPLTSRPPIPRPTPTC
jgi:hypothetical protein